MPSHPIQYVTAADGTRIAFTTLGAGPPLVFMPTLPFSHLEAMWSVEGQARWFERLGSGATVALYDGRGTGAPDDWEGVGRSPRAEVAACRVTLRTGADGAGWLTWPAGHLT